MLPVVRCDEACYGGSARELVSTGSPQNLISPGYPYVLPGYLHCRWVIRSEDPQEVIVQDAHGWTSKKMQEFHLSDNAFP